MAYNFAPAERGFAVGVYTAGAMIGATIAPPLIAWLAISHGWRAAFVTTGAAGFVWIAAWLMVYKRAPASRIDTAKNDPYPGHAYCETAPYGVGQQHVCLPILSGILTCAGCPNPALPIWTRSGADRSVCLGCLSRSRLRQYWWRHRLWASCQARYGSRPQSCDRHFDCLRLGANGRLYRPPA